jgi:membrane protein
MRQWLDRMLDLRLVREIRDDELFDQAASVAFWLLLSLPAALLAALSSVSLLGDGLADELQRASLEFIDRVFTSEAETLKDSVNDLFSRNQPGVLSVSIATSIFTLSRGFAGLIRGLDRVCDVESGRNFAHTRLLAVGLAIGTLFAVAVSTALWAVGGAVGIPTIIRLLGAFVVLVMWSATIFHIGPNHHTPWRYDLPGALVAAVGWLVLSLAFGWYVRLIGGDGNEVLGAAGALLLGLTWLWAVCVVLLIGAEVNEIRASSAGVIQESRTVLGRIRARRSDSGSSTEA